MDHNLYSCLISPSITQRREGFNNLSELFRSHGDDPFPDENVEKIINLLMKQVPYYLERKSQYLMLNCLRELAKNDSFKIIINRYRRMAKLNENSSISSKSVSNYYIFRVLVGSCIWSSLGKNKIVLVESEVDVMFEAFSIFFSAAICPNSVKIEKKLMAAVKEIWQNVPERANVLKILFNENIDQHKLIMGGFFLMCLSDTQEYNVEELATYRRNIIPAYITHVLTARKKPSYFLLLKTVYLLEHLTKDEFKELILPSVMKALLRNPELILESVCFLIQHVQFDLSFCLSDFMKVLKSPLHANEDEIRENVVMLCGNLAVKCNNLDQVRPFTQMLFSVLNGNDGKLIVNSHKISVLQAIQSVSKNAAPQDNSFYSDVCVQIVKFLEAENYEGSIMQGISTFAAWSSRLHDHIPDVAVNFLKAGINSKNSTAITRAAYCKSLTDSISLNCANKFEPMIPAILKLIDKALLQSLNVISIYEALSWGNLLLVLGEFSVLAKDNSEPMWKTIFNLKKTYFSSEKFLNYSSTEALLQLVTVCENLLCHHRQSLGDETVQIITSLCWCLANCDAKIRQSANKSVIDLLQADTSNELSSLFLDALKNLSTMKKESIWNDESTDNESGVTHVGLVHAAQCLTTITSISKGQKIELAHFYLRVLYQPVGGVPDAKCTLLWKDFLTRLNITENFFFTDQKSQIISSLKENLGQQEVDRKYIYGLFRHGGHILFPDCVPYIIKLIDEPEILTIEDEEFDIFKTPENIIYHKNVIDEAFENELNLKNFKRSTKTYTHKEELIMLEDRRRELEEKRKLGQLDLTPKQKEVVKSQLDKEAVIRNRIRKLDENASKAVFLLYAAASANLKELQSFFKSIIPFVIKYLPSKLIGEKLSLLYLDMQKYVFRPFHHEIGKKLAMLTIVANNSIIVTNNDWSGDINSEKVADVVGDICKVSNSIKDNQYYFNGPGLSYCLPFFQCIILNEIGDHRDKLCDVICKVLTKHSTMRGEVPEPLQHPRFHPRLELMKLFITMISTLESYFQKNAGELLVAWCESASGKKGCDQVSLAEINILLDNLTAPSGNVRYATLKGLAVFIMNVDKISIKILSMESVIRRLWVLNHDEDDDVAKLSKSLWQIGKLKCSTMLLDGMMRDVGHSSSDVRTSAAKAIAVFTEKQKYSIDKIVSNLLQIYRQKLVMTPAKEDKYGHIIAEAIDHWEVRSGVATALLNLPTLLDEKTIVNLAKFFVPEAFLDRHEAVHKAMLTAALAIVNMHGKKTVGKLLPVFEKFLNTAPKKAHYDAVRQSVVVLMGSLAKHLDSTDPKIKPIVAKLIEALSTPSQQVQEAVANCLHPLVPAVKEDCPQMVAKLLHILLESTNYGQRKGASYGLASLVKGLGILALKQLDIMEKLTNSIQNKKIPRYREGALFAIEQLCNMLGKLFEPYIVYILPHLLICFGDGNQHVRTAADHTARAVMSKLSAHGVKLVLPSLLAALEEDSWRTKTGSIELLGNMAFCAPKQLSSCLPSIVPHLIEVLSDSHQKVQIAGTEALKLIGSVIRNPEIQAIVPNLLIGLQNPHSISSCLETLLDTKFVHFIDAPSLALIMPVVERAFLDRSTEVRKMSAQIIGNMYSLTDQKDLTPYLPAVIPGLKSSLLDPEPKVRTVSARALGAMVRGMGESSFDDLLPWLMQTLTSEASPVDRSGAAQGLAEVVGGLGPEKLHKLMPDIMATSERQDIAPHVKDGYIMMFIFLPTVFEEEFTQYIGQIIPSILKALADENEYVRDTALRAGQRIVKTYAETAVQLLLPELENGLFHENWRIRFSSVQLLGDLLYRVSGVTGKMTTDTAHEDDNFGTEQSQKAIIENLGIDRRNRVLAGLYMGRSDLALMVRQAALHVWKVVVTNTPKTLKEILPTLFSLLLSCLASTSKDKRQVAARTMGDLVRKLSERVLPEIIPILEAGLDAEDPDHRQGVCIGLSEIMTSTSREMILHYSESLIPTVRRALCDPLEEVRESAAVTFDALHHNIGYRALDDILKPMLAVVQESSDISDFALDGLKKVMTQRSRVVLPYLIPQLTTRPVNTEALCILASVAGDSLSKHLPKILPALMEAMKPCMEGSSDEDQQAALNQCQEVVLAVQDEEGVNIILDELISSSKSTDRDVSRASVYLLTTFVTHSKADLTDFMSNLIRGFIFLATSKDDFVIKSAGNGLMAVTKKLDQADQRAMVNEIRMAIKFAASELREDELLPGFCVPKGVQSILPFYREGLLSGEGDQKEAACIGLSELIRLTSASTLKTCVIPITGPLIRILGDRFSWSVKVAVLDTLRLLLTKTGAMLKPFLPQLQTTFIKSIHDPHKGVRLKAGMAISSLVTIHTKPDPLFVELVQSLKSVDDSAIRETTLQAVRHVIIPVGNRMAEATLKSFLSIAIALLQSGTESVRLCAGGAVGAILKWLPPSESQSLVQQHILEDCSDNTVKHGRSAALFSALKMAPKQLLAVCNEDKVIKCLLNFMPSDQASIAQNGVVGVGFYILYKLQENEPINRNLVSVFSKSVNHYSHEVKQAMCRSCQNIAERICDVDKTAFMRPQVATTVIPMLVNATKEKNPVVRSSAEMALLAILKMENELTPNQEIYAALDSSAKTPLNETINKNLRKVTCIPVSEHEVDPALIV